MFTNRWLVYEYDRRSGPPSAPSGVERPPLRALDRDAVGRLFSGDPKLARRFLDFLDRGYLGVGAAGDGGSRGEWASYAWMATPETTGPPHFPGRAARSGAATDPLS